MKAKAVGHLELLIRLRDKRIRIRQQKQPRKPIKISRGERLYWSPGHD